MTQHETSETASEIERWLLARARALGHENLTDIDPDLDLIENGLLDSLRLVEFAFLLHRASGRRIDPQNLNLAQFRTLRTISDTFLSDPT
jgi:acyl carrier protein